MDACRVCVYVCVCVCVCVCAFVCPLVCFKHAFLTAETATSLIMRLLLWYHGL